jgi:hypothetical protein
MIFRSLFRRIEDTIICFRVCLPFRFQAAYHIIFELGIFEEATIASENNLSYFIIKYHESFCSVAVITFASHAKGPRFDPGRKHTYILNLFSTFALLMRIKAPFTPVACAHWDLLPKFLSIHYYTILEGVLGVERSRQAQETIICLFGLLFFSQNGMTFKKPTKIVKIQ